jgi:hypothetical protein
MSKYRILRIDHYDPVAVAKSSRRINILFAFIALVSAPVLILLYFQFGVGIDLTNTLLLILFFGLLFLLFRKFRTEKSRYETIGIIEFTKERIIKRIGETFTENSYDSIESIELRKHIPALFISDSKSGFYTFILSIKYKDSHEDNVVVSERPLEKMENLSITDTVQALKRMSAVRITIG